MFTRGIFEELNFIRGKTDNSILNNKNVNIWNGNHNSYILKSKVCHIILKVIWVETYSENFRRHYGAEYKGVKIGMTDKGLIRLSTFVILLKIILKVEELL